MQLVVIAKKIIPQLMLTLFSLHYGKFKCRHLET